MRSISLLTVAGLAACVCGPEKKPEPVKPQPAAPAPVVPKGPCPTEPSMEGGMQVVSMAYPTGNAATSVLCVQKIAPVNAFAGEPFDYTVRVTNLTSDPIRGITVTDHWPAGFAPDGAGSTGPWRIETLGGNQTESFTVRGVANADGRLTNCVDIRIDNNLCVDTTVTSPALQITKTGPAQVMKCDPITYTITVRNTGSGTARDLVITDALPDGLTANGPTSFNLAELAGGAEQSFNVSASPTRTGTFTNAASVAAARGLSAASNSVTTTVVQPALTINVTCSGRAFLEKNFSYTVNVANTGDAPCNNTVVSASIPAGTSFVSATSGGSAVGGNVQWTMPSLDAGASASMEFTVRGDTLGDKTSNASVNCNCADRVESSCTTKVEGIPAVLLEVVDLDDPIEVGKNETYVITVTNQGSAVDTNIIITCELPSEQEFVSAGGATNGTASGQTVTFAPLPTLAAKARAEWRLVVKARAEGDVRFKVSMITDQLGGRPVEETEATNLYQ